MKAWVGTTYKNTALAASSREQVRTDSDVKYFGPANWLDCTNDDTVNITLKLGSREFKVHAGETFEVPVFWNLLMNDIILINDDTVNAMTANKVLINYGYTPK